MRALALTFAFLSTSVFACPNLAGKYASCRTISGPDSTLMDVEITQTVRNRITTYVIKATDEYNERVTETYKADGKVVKEEVVDPDSGSKLQTLSTFTCSPTIFTVKSELKLDGELMMSLISNYTKSENQVKIVSVQDDGMEKIERTQICE